jgi:hypothetical protein
MKLPRAEEAVIPQNKLESYLLDTSHPVGGAKARFFIHFGFRREEWFLLGEALRAHSKQNPVVQSVSEADGVIYLVEGPLETPSGRKPRVRAVWLVEIGGLAPRFISAYPLPA